jgi:GT2 family glycosyltransferase
MITAIIPTLNRPNDLYLAVCSILNQKRLPEELIIVDQSSNDESRLRILPLMEKVFQIKLIYILDNNIRGLVEAKYVASERACGEIFCFLEDDVILEQDYIEQIELGFNHNPKMVGCCGIITNPPNQTLLYEILFNIFHLGIFKDSRVSLYGRFIGRGHNLIACDKLSGGLSAWRREVFKVVTFDRLNGFHMFEDIDFSTRVARYFDNHLYINPNARIEHNSSPINRDSLGAIQRRKLTECIIYYKKRRDWPGATFALPWLLLGMLLETLVKSFLNRSLEPLIGYLVGLRDGFAKTVVLK